MPTAISRRALARGAAWSVPVLATASAAPAFAASRCSAGPVIVRLGSGTRTVLATGTEGMPTRLQWAYTDQATGVTVTITTAAKPGTILGRRTAPNTDSYVDTDLTYDAQRNGLNIQHVTTTATGEGQDITVSFTRNGLPVPVTNFSVSIDDIDASAGFWMDAVAITSGYNLFTYTQGANLWGAGQPGTSGAANLTTGPWYKDSSGNADGNNLATDRVTLRAASLQSFSFSYFDLGRTYIGNRIGAGSDQNIQLSGMTFTAPAC